MCINTYTSTPPLHTSFLSFRTLVCSFINGITHMDSPAQTVLNPGAPSPVQYILVLCLTLHKGASTWQTIKNYSNLWEWTWRHNASLQALQRFNRFLFTVPVFFRRLKTARAFQPCLTWNTWWHHVHSQIGIKVTVLKTLNCWKNSKSRVYFVQKVILLDSNPFNHTLVRKQLWDSLKGLNLCT